MILKDKDTVKKWLRNLPLARKEMDLKIDFYNTLINDLSRIGIADKRLTKLKPEADTYLTDISNIEFYRNQIEECRKKYDAIINDWNRLSKLLSSDEISVITAKYLKGVTWDAMQFTLFFSRRQCFRILDSAIQKLIGQKVEAQ